MFGQIFLVRAGVKVCLEADFFGPGRCQSVFWADFFGPGRCQSVHWADFFGPGRCRGVLGGLLAAAVGGLAFEADVEVFAVSACVADEGGAAGVGRVLEDGFEPFFGGAAAFGFAVEGALVVAVDEEVLDLSAGDELVDEPEGFVDVEVVAAHVVEAVVVGWGKEAGVGDVDVASGLVGLVRVDGAAVAVADVADDQGIGVGELFGERVEDADDFADGVIGSPGAVWVEDEVA